MNNLSEEEIIEILKNQISDYVIGDYCEKCGHYKICNDRNEDCNFIQAIDGILDLYNKEKEKNKYSDDNIRETIIKRYHEVIEKDYVDKDKIREKIKNLEISINDIKDNHIVDVILYQEIKRLEVKKEVLNELLEED